MNGVRRRSVPRTAAAILSLAALLSLAGAAQSPDRIPPGIVRDTTGVGERFVDLAHLDPTIRFDIRYATGNNFLGRAVYQRARAVLRRPAAEAVVRAHRALLGRGYGILVFDGYRPWSVTKLFWDSTPPARRAFVADPAKGSRHNRGCAVDLSLYDCATGREVPMPSPFDDFSERAASNYTGGTAAERASRDLLRAAMENEGFTVEPLEWWHFDFADWKAFPLYDIPLEVFP